MIFDPRHQNSANFHSMENLPLNSFKEGFQSPASVQTWCQDFNCQSKDNSVFHPQNHEKKSTLAQDCVLPPSHSHTEPQTLPGGAWTTTCVKLLSLCKTMGHHLKIPWEVRHVLLSWFPLPDKTQRYWGHEGFKSLWGTVAALVWEEWLSLIKEVQQQTELAAL